MTQLNMIFSTLKQQLKINKKTYSDVAKYLKVSESSVKRLFNSQSMSIERLEQICHFIGLELTDLIGVVDQAKPRVKQLSVEQERELVADEKLLLMMISVFNGWKFDEIIEYYDLSEHACYQALEVLDKLNVIELLPFNQFKVLVAQDFAWIKNGPIETFFHQHMKNDFFDSAFNASDEFFLCLHGMLSDANNHLLQKKLRQIKQLFAELHQHSLAVGIEKASGSALVLALRPWLPGIFEKYKRKKG